MCGFCRGTKYVSYSTTRNHLSVYGDMLNPSVGKLYSFYYVAIYRVLLVLHYTSLLLIHKELEEEECAMSTDNDDGNGSNLGHCNNDGVDDRGDNNDDSDDDSDNSGEDFNANDEFIDNGDLLSVS